MHPNYAAAVLGADAVMIGKSLLFGVGARWRDPLCRVMTFFGASTLEELKAELSRGAR